MIDLEKGKDRHGKEKVALGIKEPDKVPSGLSID